MAKKLLSKEGPGEIPTPGKRPEIDPDEIPDHLALPEEDPDIIPDEDPEETYPPPDEMPAPGEGP